MNAADHSASDEPLGLELDFDERMELHNELYQAAVDVMPELGIELAVDAEMRRRLLRATELFERVIGLRPGNWNAMGCWGTRGGSWGIENVHTRRSDGPTHSIRPTPTSLASCAPSASR
jgi:hypothetical protein